MSGCGAALAKSSTAWTCSCQMCSTRPRPPISDSQQQLDGAWRLQDCRFETLCMLLRMLCSMCCPCLSCATPMTWGRVSPRDPTVLQSMTVFIRICLIPYFCTGAECDNAYDTRFKPERILIYDKHPGGIGLSRAVREDCVCVPCSGTFTP